MEEACPPLRLRQAGRQACVMAHHVLCWWVVWPGAHHGWQGAAEYPVDVLGVQGHACRQAGGPTQHSQGGEGGGLGGDGGDGGGDLALGGGGEGGRLGGDGEGTGWQDHHHWLSRLQKKGAVVPAWGLQVPQAASMQGLMTLSPQAGSPLSPMPPQR